jgi:hypothetical protein
MPFGVQRGWMRYALPRPEILSYPLETHVIDSVVLNSSGISPDASGPYMNRRYLVAGTILSKRADGTYEQYTAATDSAGGTVQQVTLVGPPTGGTYALGLEGQETPPPGTSGALSCNANAATIQAALVALPAVGASGVVVTGPVADNQGSQVYTLTFASSLGNVPLIRADPTQLTGPGNQDITTKSIAQGASAGGSQNIAGILYDTVEFADGSELSDEPVAMLRRNVSFRATAIVNFATLNSGGAVTTALPTCEFV